MNKENRDEELEKRMLMFDGWVMEGKIPSSSKVIPVRQSLDGLQWVLPTQQVLEILRNSRSFALANCLCRIKHKRCKNPLEVCFYTNDVDENIFFHEERCYGCGLCVPTCPSNSIRMVLRKDKH